MNKFKVVSTIKIVIVVLGVLLLGCAIIIAISESNAQNDYTWTSTLAKKVPDITDDGIDYKYNERIRNVLFIGVDNDGVEENIIYQSGGQADVLMLLSIDYLYKTINVIQINRDTMTLVKKLGILGDVFEEEKMQIALSYAYGNNGQASCENTLAAVKAMFHNIAIDDYVSFGMDAIPILTNVLDGIEVTLADDLTELDPSYTKGSAINLKGEAALNYLRARQEVTGGNNIKRLERHKDFTYALLEKIRNDSSFDKDKINSIYDALKDYMITSLEKKEIVKVMNSVSNFIITDIYTPKGVALYESEFVEYILDDEDLLKNTLRMFFKEN